MANVFDTAKIYFGTIWIYVNYETSKVMLLFSGMVSCLG